MYMKFLCEFWSAIETLVVIITEEKLPHCFYWWYGDPLLATSCHCHWADLSCWSGVAYVCLYLHHLDYSDTSPKYWLYCLGVYLASLLLTHQVPDGSRHSRSGVSGLNPGSLGWLWTVSGEDPVWDDSLWTWRFSLSFPGERQARGYRI